MTVGTIALASPALAKEPVALLVRETPVLIAGERSAREQAGSVLVGRCMGEAGESGETRIAACRNLIEVSDSTRANPFTHFVLGVALYDIDDFGNAAWSMGQALERAPDDGFILMVSAGYQADFDPEFDIESELEAAARLIPNNANVWFNLGLEKARRGASGAALPDLDRALERNPAMTQAHALRAAVNVDVGNYQAALDDVHEALSRGFEDVTWMLLITSRAYKNLGEYEKSEWEAQHLVDRDAESAEGYNALCWAQVLQRKAVDALDNCNRSLELEPGLAAALDSRGMVHLLFRNNANARDDFDAALRIQPDLAVSLYGRGVARRRLGEDAAGRDDQRRALEADPTAADDYRRMNFEETD